MARTNENRSTIKQAGHLGVRYPQAELKEAASKKVAAHSPQICRQPRIILSRKPFAKKPIVVKAVAKKSSTKKSVAKKAAAV